MEKILRGKHEQDKWGLKYAKSIPDMFLSTLEFDSLLARGGCMMRILWSDGGRMWTLSRVVE